jgi:hypothetical protein
MKLPAIPRWDNIAAPDLTNSLRMFREGMSGIGGMIDNQLTRNQKVVDEQDATNLYNFKNALSGAMTSPEAIQEGITSGQYAAMANAMGVRPEQARGFLDMDKLVPEARTRQAQEVARDEAAQLKASLPIIQGLESRLMEGDLTAEQLNLALAAYAQANMIKPDQEFALRKSLLGIQDANLQRADAATQRHRTLDANAIADKLKADTQIAKNLLDAFNASQDNTVNASTNYQTFRAKLVEAGLPVPVINDTLTQFRDAMNTANPTELMGNQALAEAARKASTEANQRTVASLEAGEQAVKQYKAGTLAQLGTPNGAYGEPEGSKAVAETMEAIGIGPAAKDNFADRRGHVIKVLDKYTNKGIPADVISMFLKETPAEDPWFGIELTDKALSVGLDARLKTWLSKQENLDTIQKLKTINEEANRRRAALYEGRSAAASQPTR